MVIPDSASHEIKRLKIPRGWLKAGAWVTALMLVLLVGTAIHDRMLLAEVQTLRSLKDENIALRAAIDRLDARAAGLGSEVSRLVEFNARLRRLTMLSDPERNLGVGPVGAASPTDGPGVGVLGIGRELRGAAERSMSLIDARIEWAKHETAEALGEMQALELFLEDQQALLMSTPSLLPARGWRTSNFGFRVDPYTGQKQMHAGIDISGNVGETVRATADGIVTWAATQGSYGNVVALDHGHGLSTLYGHLLEIGVKVGERVRRGDRIATLGNTGRSTGPHVHYEVRLDGIPLDPERFILE